MSKRAKSAPKIIQFQKEDAQKLAELLNSFDKEGLWPGGFTGGVPYTAERVLDSFAVSAKSICILVSTLKGKFTGICSLHPHYEDAEAAYIGVLGVHPDYLGKGHGKALILKSIQIASESGLRRVDLHTWAGNLRAVPLYKKCGMYWVPETSVYMQDYVPGIISFPIAEEFFKKHNWYSSQNRKLELSPDKFELDGMEVFPYEFSADEDKLRIWIDRYGRSILGIERTLDGEHLKVMTRLRDHKVIAGIEQILTIEIQNNTKENMQGSLFLSGFEGLDFTELPTQSFVVKKGNSIRLKAKFVVDPETEVPDEVRKQKAIRINLVVNGKLIPFEAGMRIMPLLEIKTHPESIVVSPGTAGTIQFNIFNNSKEPFTGNVFIVDERDQLSPNKKVVPIEAPPRSYCGCEVGIKISEDQATSAIPMKLFPKGEAGSTNVEAKPHLTHIKCLKPGGIVASIEDTKQGEAIFIENEDVLAWVRLRGALLFVIYKNAVTGRKKVLGEGRFEVGPPYGFTTPIDFKYKICRNLENLELILTGMHPDKPGLKMTRELTFYAGTPLIKEKIRIVNLNTSTTYKLNVRISRAGGGTKLYHKMVVPLKNITEHEMIGFPVSESDLPTDPKAFKESWICLQNEAQDYCFGQIWSNEKLAKVKIGETGFIAPEYELGEIKPGQSTSTSEFYYAVERGRWHNIRKKWKQLIEKKLDKKETVARAKPLFEIQLEDNILYDDSELRTHLKVTNLRNKGASGTIKLEPPTNWKIIPSRIKIENITAKKTLNTDISVIPPSQAELGIFTGNIKFSAENQEILSPLDLCVLSTTHDSPVTVEQDKEETKPVYKVSNGLIQFKASSEFAGCLYFLGKDGINQLATSFPSIKTKVFLENYSGGIRAVYLGESFDFQKSKTHEEKYHARPFEEGCWKGVQFISETERQEELKGIVSSVSYLTLPFSNVLKIKRRFQNPTSASFDFTGCLWLSPNVGDNFLKNEAIFPRGEKTLRYKRAEGFAISSVNPSKGWILVENNEAKLGLGMIAGNTDQSTIISLDLGKTLLELFILSRIQLQPGESCELEDYLVLTQKNYEFVERLAKILRESLYARMSV